MKIIRRIYIQDFDDQEISNLARRTEDYRERSFLSHIRAKIANIIIGYFVRS